jgi:hypothetical protein
MANHGGARFNHVGRHVCFFLSIASRRSVSPSYTTMFTYCRKKSSSVRETDSPYAYHMSKWNTLEGFGKKAHLCQSLPPAWVQGRRIPQDLLVLEGQMRGQGLAYQPYCGPKATIDHNGGDEPEGIRFTTFRPPPVLPKGIHPGAPVPTVEVKAYGGGACQHVGGRQPCGGSCACGPSCQCKETFRGMNLTRPMAGPPGMSLTDGCRFAF